MAYSITHRDLSFAHGAASRALHRIGSFREKGALVTQQAVQSVMVAGSTFGFATLAGWKGSIDVLGVPVDLGSGILLNIIGYAGLGGPWSKVLHDLGDGALAAYFAKLGANYGYGIARKGGGPGAHAKGENMLSSGERRQITPNELASIAMSAHA